MAVRIGEIEFKSKKFEVLGELVDKKMRYFAYVNGAALTSDSYEELEKKVRKAIKQAEATVSVPFIYYTYREKPFDARWDDDWTPKEVGEVAFHDGVGKKLHAQNNDIMVEWVGRSKKKGSDKTQRFSEYGGTKVLRPIDEDERFKLAALFKQMIEARDTYNKYLNERTISLKQAMKDAIGKALGELVEDDDDADDNG